MSIKISFRVIVTILSLIIAVLLGLTRISDPEFVQVMRLKYFDVLFNRGGGSRKAGTNKSRIVKKKEM